MRSRMSPRSETCTTQLSDGSFCERKADDRLPNRICAHHAIKVHLAVLEYAKHVDLSALPAMED